MVVIKIKYSYKYSLHVFPVAAFAVSSFLFALLVEFVDHQKISELPLPLQS